MKRHDEGHEETEEVLRKIENRINAEFKQAEKEVQEKLDDYMRRFRIKDELKRKALEAGEITEKEYKDWLTGQVMIGKRWEEMRDTIAQDFTHADQIARSIAFGYMPDVYAINHNYATFQIEKAGHVDTSYTLYDKQTVERLILDDRGDFIPKPGKRVSRLINEGKTLAWNKMNVQSVMLQGILQGESIGNIATRLSKAVGEQNRGVSIRNARTLTTGVENAGRVDSYERANKMGINCQKQWLATLDNRTRHSHRELDGVCVDYDKPFENEDGEIMYPGDPTADAANIYNCRCTLIASIKGFERDWTGRENTEIDGMTYQEWKESHESESHSIYKQDQMEERMKEEYNAEYRHYAQLPTVDEDAKMDKRSGGTLSASEGARDENIDYIEPAVRTEPASEAEIIDMLTVDSDPTEGSCSSVAFAYAGNKAGYYVNDFRGGASCNYFANTDVISKIAVIPGVNSELVADSNDFNAVKGLLKSVERGKEYILSTGSHVAVVRKKMFGYEYLEMQGVGENGWNKLDTDALANRFGCRKTHSLLGVETKATNALIDIDSLKGKDEFTKILGYLNTEG